MKYWDSFWSNGADSGCIGATDKLRESFPSYYESWEQVAKEVVKARKSGFRCLDVACGKGEVSKVLSEQLAHTEVNFTGIDRANISYSLDIPEHSVELFAGENFENFFNTNRKFELIVSSFGIEYLPVEESAKLLVEFLEDNGLVALNTHLNDSIISKVSLEEISAIRDFFHDAKLALIEKELSTNFNVELAKVYLIRLNELNEQHDRRLAGCGLTDAVVNSFASSQRKMSTSIDLKSVKSTYEDYIERLNDQLRASRKAQELRQLISKLDFEMLYSKKLYNVKKELTSQFLLLRK